MISVLVPATVSRDYYDRLVAVPLGQRYEGTQYRLRLTVQGEWQVWAPPPPLSVVSVQGQRPMSTYGRSSVVLP
jgi:hypothetical protein